MVLELGDKDAFKRWVLEHLWGYRCARCHKNFIDFVLRKCCPECEQIIQQQSFFGRTRDC